MADEGLPYQPAPLRPLPRTPFYSVEYPGYVSSNAEAVDGALRTLGGQAAVTKVFKHPRARILDLKLRPEDLFAHPIPGESLNTNKILLQVTTRRRRRRVDGEALETQLDATSPSNMVLTDQGPLNQESPNRAQVDALEGEWEDEGVYTAKLLGPIQKTVRFRAMADYQYAPDENDPIIQLRARMEKLDFSAAETIQNYSFPKEKEDYSIPLDSAPTDDPLQPMSKSNLRLPPWPIFSRAVVPAQYNFKANPYSIVETVHDAETGAEKQRLINKTRFKGFGSIAIDFDNDGPIPKEVTPQMASALSSVSKSLLDRVVQAFAARPVWTRVALLNQFSVGERKEIFHSKMIIPLASYAFNDGPYRDMYIRFGYDPRKDVEARFFQRVTFRYTTPKYSRRRPVVEGRLGDPARLVSNESMSHIFDGKTAPKEVVPGFQLCDIRDPLLERLIMDASDLRSECHERDGWYSAASFDRIKAITRRKLFGLLEEGRIIPDSECADILERKTTLSKSAGTHELRIVSPEKAKKRKRNRAKGAGPPEEEVAARLMKTLRQQQAGPVDDGTDDIDTDE